MHIPFVADSVYNKILAIENEDLGPKQKENEDLGFFLSGTI